MGSYLTIRFAMFLTATSKAPHFTDHLALLVNSSNNLLVSLKLHGLPRDTKHTE
jgi:hypothetical protein